MNRHHKRIDRRRERYLRQNGRITDRYQLRLWWLRGTADQAAGFFRPPLHPDLYDEHDNGGCPPGAGASATATSKSMTFMRSRS